jgi:DMSO/TMAO reductase YedYZ molybdopterin-dependent catalytic subunit
MRAPLCRFSLVAGRTSGSVELRDRDLARSCGPLVSNGAPLRGRVERQLGYKHAKYVSAIELVASLDDIRGGKGGHWEDEGYAWYAGI